MFLVHILKKYLHFPHNISYHLLSLPLTDFIMYSFQLNNEYLTKFHVNFKVRPHIDNSLTIYKIIINPHFTFVWLINECA